MGAGVAAAALLSARAAADSTTRARALIHVTITAETLMALARAADTDPSSTAHVHGYGPVPAVAIADLLQHGIFRCQVVDGSHGTVLGVGRSTFTPGYPPGTRLRSLLDEVSPSCDIPGCTIPARSCDLDHRHPYARGGATCECNVRPLCRTHHRLKTARLIRAVPSTDPDDPPGTWVWITRTGRRYTAHQHVPLPYDVDADAGPRSGQPPEQWPDQCPAGAPACQDARPVDHPSPPGPSAAPHETGASATGSTSRRVDKHDARPDRPNRPDRPDDDPPF